MLGLHIFRWGGGFTREGVGQKARYVPWNPGKTKHVGGTARTIAGIIPGVPKKFEFWEQQLAFNLLPLTLHVIAWWQVLATIPSPASAFCYTWTARQQYYRSLSSLTTTWELHFKFASDTWTGPHLCCCPFLRLSASSRVAWDNRASIRKSGLAGVMMDPCWHQSLTRARGSMMQPMATNRQLICLHTGPNRKTESLHKGGAAKHHPVWPTPLGRRGLSCKCRSPKIIEEWVMLLQHQRQTCAKKDQYSLPYIYCVTPPDVPRNCDVRPESHSIPLLGQLVELLQLGLQISMLFQQHLQVHKDRDIAAVMVQGLSFVCTHVRVIEVGQTSEVNTHPEKRGFCSAWRCPWIVVRRELADLKSVRPCKCTPAKEGNTCSGNVSMQARLHRAWCSVLSYEQLVSPDSTRMSLWLDNSSTRVGWQAGRLHWSTPTGSVGSHKADFFFVGCIGEDSVSLLCMKDIPTIK